MAYLNHPIQIPGLPNVANKRPTAHVGDAARDSLNLPLEARAAHPQGTQLVNGGAVDQIRLVEHGIELHTPLGNSRL